MTLPLHARPEERRALRFQLEKGRSVLMLAPRRIGKTWLLKALAEDLRGRWVVVLCNLEGMVDEKQVLQDLCRQIEEGARLKGRFAGRLKQLWDNIQTRDLSDGLQTVLRTDWKAFASSLVATMAAQDHDTVILVDEIALFVLGLQRRDPGGAHDFLYHLRNLRQAHPKVRWVFTGSIGLDVVARRAEVAGALVDLLPFTLEPFGEEAARAYLNHLSEAGEIQRPFALDAEAFRHLARELGWLSPFYLLALAEEMRPTGPVGAGGRPLASMADLDRAFDRMLANDRRILFATWEEHPGKNFPPEEAAQLRLILDTCAARAEGELFDTLTAQLSQPPNGLSRATLRDRLSALVNDAYLDETEEDERPRYRFRSGLLRRYWRKYHAA